MPDAAEPQDPAGPVAAEHGGGPDPVVARHAAAVGALDALTRRLRVACPWDREQDERSIVPHTLEEAYELADAVQAGDDAKVLDELGDVLFQVHFLGLLLEERGAGSLGDVADHVRAKLVRRHPHVFAPGTAEAEAGAAPTGGRPTSAPGADVPAGQAGDGGGRPGRPLDVAPSTTSTAAAAATAAEGQQAARPRDADAVLARWDAVKATEPGREPGIFGEVPENLPSLLHARKVQRRAKSAGLPPADRDALLDVAREGIDVLEVAAAAGDRRATMDALGDLLFAVVGVARDAKADPEIALRAASGRFRRRVEDAETGAAAEGRDWRSLAESERLARYAEAARRQRDAAG